MAQVRAWPMCSDPVTLGGGIMITKVGFSLSESSGLKRPSFSHQSYLYGNRVGIDYGGTVIAPC